MKNPLTSAVQDAIMSSDIDDLKSRLVIEAINAQNAALYARIESEEMRQASTDSTDKALRTIAFSVASAIVSDFQKVLNSGNPDAEIDFTDRVLSAMISARNVDGKTLPINLDKASKGLTLVIKGWFENAERATPGLPRTSSILDWDTVQRTAMEEYRKAAMAMGDIPIEPVAAAVKPPRNPNPTYQRSDGSRLDVGRFLEGDAEAFALPVFDMATLNANGREYVVMERDRFDEFCSKLVDEAHETATAAMLKEQSGELTTL